MKSNLLSYFLLLCFLFEAVVSEAAIIHVPSDCPTIQQAIDAAGQGDTVLISPGVYIENLSIFQKSLTLASLELISQDTSYISQTIINGGHAGSVIFIQNLGEERFVRVEGLSITNGYASFGGGIRGDYTTLDLRHLRVYSNSAISNGGGIFLEGCNATLHKIDLTNNYAFFGGGMRCDISTVEASGIIFKDNDSHMGGGLHSASSFIHLFDSEILHNSGDYAGGMTSIGNPAPVLENVLIKDNHSDYTGGGVMCKNSDPVFTGCLFTENISDNGGGIYSTINSHPVLRSTILTGNVARAHGGGIFFGGDSSPVFDTVDRSSIFLNDAANAKDIYLMDISLHLILDTFSVLRPTDYYASPILNFTSDILNFKIPQTHADLYVSPDGDDLNSGLDPEHPLKTIGKALSVIYVNAFNARTLFLMKGVFSPSVNGESFPLNIPDYLTVKGNSTSETILDGESSARIIYVHLNAVTRLEDFTVKGGNASAGGGIFCAHSDLKLEELVITQNIADLGGGIYCNQSSPFMKDLVIHNNSAETGGGMYISYSNPDIQSTALLSNHAVDGGGIYANHSNISMVDSRFMENVAQDYGGGICLQDNPILDISNTFIDLNHSDRGGFLFSLNSSVRSVNNQITNNIADLLGSVFYSTQSVIQVLNNTITGNLSDQGLGVFIDSDISMKNSISWDNTLNNIYLIKDSDTTKLRVDHCDMNMDDIYNVNGNIVNWGDGNIWTDPGFATYGEYPYSLGENSPCTDAGSPDTAGLLLPPGDIIGNFRIWDGDGDGVEIIDLGAFEYGSVQVGAYEHTRLVDNGYPCNLSVYPNPSETIVTISINCRECLSTQIRVFDSLGLTVKELAVLSEKGKNKIQMDVSALQDGVYFIQLVYGKNYQVCKLIKVR